MVGLQGNIILITSLGIIYNLRFWALMANLSPIHTPISQ